MTPIKLTTISKKPNSVSPSKLKRSSRNLRPIPSMSDRMSQSNDNSTDNELATIEDDCATEEQIDSVDRSDSVATVILVIDDDERCVSSGPITPPGSTNDVLIYEDQIVSYSPAIANCPFTDLSETFQLEIDDNEGEGETTFESTKDPEKRNLLERRTR